MCQSGGQPFRFIRFSEQEVSSFCIIFVLAACCMLYNRKHEDEDEE
jgi:hypothetical protein